MTEPQAPVSIAVRANNHLGETPLWCSERQLLYWVNCENPPQVHRFSPETGAHDTWPMPIRVGGIALRPGGQLLVVLSDGVYRFDPDSKALTLHCPSPLPEHVSLHECQCDRQGRLWVGAYDHTFTPTHRDVHGAAYFRLDGNQLTRVIDRIAVANGLAFNPDGTVLYAANAPSRRVEQWDMDPASGEIGNRRTFFQLNEGEGFLDGACVDTEGGYWLAAVGSGTLRRYLPDGSLERVVPLPVSNPTKPVFGGPALDTLFVTTTQLPIGPDSEANGDVYALQPGFTGLPEAVVRD